MSFCEQLESVMRSGREQGLSAMQVVALTIIKRHRCRMTDLSLCLGVSTAAVTGLVDRLEEKGMVVRQPDTFDRRSVYVYETAVGTRCLEKLEGAGA